MLLSEMVRQIADEEVFFDESGLTDQITAASDWVTVRSKSITLSKEKIIYLKFIVEVTSGTYGNGRVLLDGDPLVSTGQVVGTTVTRETYVILSAGTHTFDFQLACWYAGTSSYVRLTTVYIAALNFADKDKQKFQGEMAVDNTATYTILNQSFTTPSARKLPIGQIKKYTCIITVYMEGVDYRNSVIRSPGETDLYGSLNWKIYLNGTQQSWTEKRNDFNSGHIENLSYAEGAYGKLIVVLDPSTEYNIQIKVHNHNTGTTRNVRAVIWIMLCPWIIPPTEYEPFTLDFPQGSTLYLILEPLDSDPTKTVKIGKKRFISFGDATDYYYTASGTGILNVSYTFEITEVSNCVLLISGFGGCISIIGVDVR